MDLDKAIKNRRTVKKFKSKTPDWRDVIEAIDVARYAPMAGGNYSLKFIMIKDEESIRVIKDACQQPFIAQSKIIVVVCSDPSRTINAYGKKGEIYTRQQAGAAIQNFWLKLTELGLSTTWVGHFAEDQIKDQLGIPDTCNVEAVFPIGYELEKKYTRKAKIDLNNVLYFEEYGNPKMKTEKALDV